MENKEPAFGKNGAIPNMKHVFRKWSGFREKDTLPNKDLKRRKQIRKIAPRSKTGDLALPNRLRLQPVEQCERYATIFASTLAKPDNPMYVSGVLSDEGRQTLFATRRKLRQAG